MANAVSRRSIIYDLTFNTGQATKASSDMGNSLDDVGKRIDNAGKEIDNFSKKTLSSVQRLRQIKNELNNFQGSEERFKALTLEAAKLQDQLNKTNDRIRTLASSTKNIQALISVAQGLTGVFTAAQGAAALFGSKNEDLQKTLVKLQGSLALLHGVQAAVSTVTEESAAKTVILANAQKAYAFVVGTSTGAMKAFRIALAATGVGLLVIALGALIANFDKVKDKVFEFIPALEKVGSAVKGFIAGFVETFKVIGDVIGSFFSDGIGAAIDEAKDAGVRVSNAFNEGYDANEKEKEKERDANEKEKEKERAAKLSSRFILQAKLQKDLLEAQGKDSFDLQKRILQEELKLLDKHSDDYAVKLNEINVLIAKRNKEFEDEIKRRNDAIRAGLQGFADEQKDFVKIIDEILPAEEAEIVIPIKSDVPPESSEILTQESQALDDINIKLAKEIQLRKDLASVAESSGQIFANLAQIAGASTSAQIGLSIASVIAANAEALAKGVAKAIEIGFPQNLAAIFSTIATVTSVFTQIKSISQQAQAAQAQANQKANAFAEGEVDIHRPGETRGKDSIPAVIMPGESVITTEKTSKYKPFLKAIHEGTLEDLIRVNYVEPALAISAMEQAQKDSAIDYSQRFYKQLLATHDGNYIGKRTVQTLERIERKIGNQKSSWYV